MSIYLDYNASSPIHPLVLDEMVKIYQESYGNASSRTHAYGQSAAEVVRNSRRIVADFINISPAEVIFTSGATESNNIVLLGLQYFAKKTGRKHIISTKTEHKSILEPLEFLKTQGFEIEFLDVSCDGRIDPTQVAYMLRTDTLLVTTHHANNETGVIQPIEELADLLIDKETLFHVDCAQTLGKLPVDLGNLNIDFMTATAHKMGGPQGVGLLSVRKNKSPVSPLKPIMFGGSQEYKLRPGSLPVALIGGFAKAIDLADSTIATWEDNMLKKKDDILKQIQAVNYRLNGDVENTMANTINVSFPGVNSEALMLTVRNSIAISNGSACTAQDYSPSHVLTAMGLDDEIIESAVRISWGLESVAIDLSDLLKAIHFLGA